MRNNFEELETQIEISFRSFVNNLLRLDSEPLKYYYWTRDFFEINGGLSFTYFELDSDQKDAINVKGQNYFSDEEVFFEVNKNSHRHDLLIKNIRKIFPENKKLGQNNRYEYIKEYIFWQILEELSINEHIIAKKISEIQKRNFILTYLNYLFESTQRPSFEEFKNYMAFEQTSQYEEIKIRLDDLDKKNFDNSIIRKKLSKLYVHREEQAKIHFVFSHSGSSEKEELRELLDVMGREKTGAYYRGQASSLWNLDSSLTREKKYVVHEAEMYYDILSSKPDAFVEDKSVYERLITMQHYGMPTRLMDITRNPLVAIFFACNNLEKAKSDGIIFTFAPNNADFLNFEDNRLDSLRKLFDKDCQSQEPNEFLNSICFVKGVAKNQRISSQSGDFIFVGKGVNMQKKLYALPALTIIIDAVTKKVLLEQLESLNIHGGAVYPDLSHMSNYVRNKYLYDKKSEKDFITDMGVIKSKLPMQKQLKEIVFESKKSENLFVKPLINDFNEKDFWTTSKKELLKTFSKDNNLKEQNLKEIINEYLFSEKVPLRHDIAKIMQVRPKVNEYRTIVADLVNQIVEFVNLLKVK